MKTTHLIKIAAVVAFLTSGFTVSAITINLDDSNSDTRYLGKIVNGIPSSAGNELNWLNEVIGMAIGTTQASTNPAGETLTRSTNNFGTLPTATGGVKVESNANRTVGSNAYALGKYGAGGTTKETHVWYIGNLNSGDVINMNGARNGLSHTTLFGGQSTTVPDSGATLALLGFSLAGLGFLKRRRK